MCSLVDHTYGSQTSESQPLQFQYPLYVALHPNGKLFVTDHTNHHVQVLNHELKLMSFSHLLRKVWIPTRKI